LSVGKITLKELLHEFHEIFEGYRPCDKKQSIEFLEMISLSVFIMHLRIFALLKVFFALFISQPARDFALAECL